MSLFNPILDSDQYHASEVTIIGTLNGKPDKVQIIRTPSGEEVELRGRDANVVVIDFEAAARRNIGYIRENIARRKAAEEKERLKSERFQEGDSFVSWN